MSLSILFFGLYLLSSLFKTEKRSFVMKVKQPQKLPWLIFSHVAVGIIAWEKGLFGVAENGGS